MTNKIVDTQQKYQVSLYYFNKDTHIIQNICTN